MTVVLDHTRTERNTLMPRRITVSWTHTEDFTRTFEVDDEIDLDDKEAIEELICDLTQEELSESFDGCTNRTIYDVAKGE